MELWELYDDKKNKTGLVIERGEKIPKGYHFLCVEIWIINEDKEVLLTQRSKEKESYPLYWETTGGGIKKGEKLEDAAVREVQEETGISVDREQLHLMGDYVGDNYIVYTYFYFLKGNPDPELKLQKEEVADSKWVAIKNLKNQKNMIEEKVDRFFKYSK